mgnify:CR=1 FL=1
MSDALSVMADKVLGLIYGFRASQDGLVVKLYFDSSPVAATGVGAASVFARYFIAPRALPNLTVIYAELQQLRLDNVCAFRRNCDAIFLASQIVSAAHKRNGIAAIFAEHRRDSLQGRT